MSVRHYMAPNGYRLTEAVERRWIVPAICGALFEPAVDEVVDQASRGRLGICPKCHAMQHRPESLRPHYVYRCYNEAHRLLYVGCSVSPPLRMEGHRANSWWWPQVSYVRNLVFPDRDTALARERSAIFNEMPACNVRGRWFKRNGRESWAAEDYLEFRQAVVQSVESTHGVYGVNTRQLLADIATELHDRFGVTDLSVKGGAA